MAGTFKDKHFYIARSPIFKKQSGWDSPVANGDLTWRQKQNTKTPPTIALKWEDDLHCKGEYIIFREISESLWRLRFGFFGTPQEMAGWYALAVGSSALGSGTPENEVQTATDADVDGGAAAIVLTHEGKTLTTAPVAWDANATAWQNALRAVLGTTNVTVTGTLAAGLVVTFTGYYGNANMPLLTFGAGFTDGGSPVTPVFAQTTPGSQCDHSITRDEINEQPPQTSLIWAFETDATLPKKGKNIVVNSWAVSGEAPRQKVLCEVDLIGSGDVSEVSGFAVPSCEYPKDLRFSDTGLRIASNWYSVRSFRHEYNNNIYTGDDSFISGSIYPDRLERGDRTTSMTYSVFGSEGDPLATLVQSATESPVELHLGKPGDRLSIYSPAQNLLPEDQFTEFVGEANRSALNIRGENFFHPISGNVDYAVALIDQSTAFLTT